MFKKKCVMLGCYFYAGLIHSFAPWSNQNGRGRSKLGVEIKKEEVDVIYMRCTNVPVYAKKALHKILARAWVTSYRIIVLNHSKERVGHINGARY